MNAESGNQPAPDGTLKIKIFGVGGAGGNLIPPILNACGAAAEAVALHTNARVLAGISAGQKLLLGARALRGMGAGGDPAMGRNAAEEEESALRQLCQGCNLVFIVAGLGGGTGTGAGPVLARIAREAGALTLVMAVLPFDFEGSRRGAQAEAGLRQMRLAADAVICLSNQKAAKLLDQHTSLTEAFCHMNTVAAEGVNGIWQMLSREGLMPVDFGDLSAVLRGRHAQSAFATIKAHGENRVREILEKFSTHPFLDGGQALADADSMLVNITGGRDLTMAEINRIMEQLNRQSDGANVVVGASVEPEWESRLQVTVVISRNGCAPEEEEARNEGVPRGAAEPASSEDSPFLAPGSTPRPPSRYVAPPPELSAEQTAELLDRQRGGARKGRKNTPRLKQGVFDLEVVSKGRFEKGEPTVHHGEDLDVPTYIRRGVSLN